MMKKKLLLLVLLLAFGQIAKAWEGGGGSTNPYLIQNSTDWKQLADDVKAGNNYSGKFFRMTANFNSNGVSVGDENHPFSGTFDGDGFCLAYYRMSYDGIDDYCAPFVLLNGATIRHFNTIGNTNSLRKYAAGIASMIDGSAATRIEDCHVKISLRAETSLGDEAVFGGLVGVVKESCTASPTITGSSFSSSFRGSSNKCGGLVGYTSIPVTFDHCLFAPSLLDGTNKDCATFVRTANNVTCPMTECYYTESFGTVQGVGVFKEVIVPQGLTCTIEQDADIHFNGEKFWKSGTWILIEGPAVAGFNHWDTGTGGCFVSNAMTQNGRHQLRDIRKRPNLTASTTEIAPKETTTMDGTRYRYLYRSDYHLYLSDEYCEEKRFQFDSNDELFLWAADGTKLWVTVVTGWENGAIPSDGAQIHNDLKRLFTEHTYTAAIAPGAFKGCTELKTLYFKDTDSNNSEAMAGFDFLIGDSAFANCPNLTEVKMMQYTTSGSNHWEALAPTQVGYVADNVFGGSPNAFFSVDASQYQSYLNSNTWKNLRNRIEVYNHTDVDMSVNGAKYSQMRNTKGEPLKNNEQGHKDLRETIQLWNADYYQFNSADLLAERDKENIWYTTVVGANDSYLKSNDGVMRIYNDPGSVYNYKTIAIARNAFKDCKELKAIEFWQTNGRGENSYSDLKIVIQNGAFAGCDNLKELRLLYYVQDGDDHWETLGPKDVIPGNDIFGLSLPDESTDGPEMTIPEGFKIIVSPDRYMEFRKDVNWIPYMDYIEPMDFAPTRDAKKDFEVADVKYGYMTNEGGLLETSNTVSQDVSWWTAPRIIAEIVLDVATFFWGAAPSSEIMKDMRVWESLRSFLAQRATFENLTTKQVLDKFLATGADSYVLWLRNYPGTSSFIIDLAEHGLINAQTVAFNSAAQCSQALLKIIDKSILDQLKKSLINYASFLSHILEQSLLENYGFYVPVGLAWSIPIANAITTASVISSKYWGGSGSYDGDAFRKGIKANLLSNIHEVGVVGGGYVITTPQKNMVYHSYLKEIPDTMTHVNIYAGTGSKQGRNNNSRTMTMAKKAFHNHKNVTHVFFHSNPVASDEAIPMLFTFPDSAFVGCSNLQCLDLRVRTDGHGEQALGPENFILAGDSVFAGLRPDKFHIIIDPSRKQDFLDNESWKPLERFFVYEPANPTTQYTEYGGNYAYSYEAGTTQKVNKVSGHIIEHTIVTGPDTKFLQSHQGALKLCNDIGTFNNFQLDAVTRSAFKGNQDLRVVYFTDLMGSGAYGDSYTGLDVVLMDSCFKDCKNLANIDLLYMVTDGDNHIDPIKPSQLKIGRGVVDGTNAKFKMMPEQVEWFMADTTWAKYSDRFLPCVIRPGDKAVRKAFKDMAYYDMAHSGYDWIHWDEYIDLARISGSGFETMKDMISSQKDDILSFGEFSYFANVGLDYVGKEWFRGCRQMSNIMLPATIKSIKEYAFASCSALREIELPAAVSEIAECAFADCGAIQTIVVRSNKPATLGSNAFPKNNGMKIYVPKENLNDYLTAWAEYKDYIVGNDGIYYNKVVKLDKAGTLAEKLGLDVEWSYAGIVGGDEPRYIHGYYTKYDSLTISGPLNDVDLYVIRYLAGNAGYDRGGKPTDGRLRYLNLYDARIIKDDDDKAHYVNLSAGTIPMWYDVENTDELPDRLFNNCTVLQTLILPKSLDKIKNGIFIGCSGLKHLAITGKVKEYSAWADILFELTNPLEEMVLLTDNHLTSSAADPWGQPISNVYLYQSQLQDYLGDDNLNSRAEAISAPFKDDAVMRTLASKGEFFPSIYLGYKNVDKLFAQCGELTTFDDFYKFNKVEALDGTFAGDGKLKRLTIPASVKSISATTFAQCVSLDTLTLQSEQVPTLGENAFSDLPADFCILVPRTAVKLYRTTWPQYADHINPQSPYDPADELIVVTVKEPNTLGEALGLTIKRENTWGYNIWRKCVRGVRGDFSNIHKLKVIGPLGETDFDVLRYLSGYCPWLQSRNYVGRLEYLDLYDADFRKTDDYAIYGQKNGFEGNDIDVLHADEDNQLFKHAFLKAYNLQTLILPKTCKKVEARALQECEGLEVLVLGDDMEDFNWNALDDNVMMTRMYLLAKKKVEISTQNAVWRALCNNYNPTFDAFYVLPSLYKEYLNDKDYTGSSWQRTNNVTTGLFTDDANFRAFAAHGTATPDELANVFSVKDWFKGHEDVTDLSPLRYTMVDTLNCATFAGLTKLEQVSLPQTLRGMEEGLFKNAKKLRYADFQLCDSTDVVSKLRGDGIKRLGIDTQQTLVYLPETYGKSDGVNIIAKEGKEFHAQAFRMIDSLDYLVPYPFVAEKVENTRALRTSATPYTVCVPYKLNVPAYARAYMLSDRDGNTLVFDEVTGELETMMPYLIKVVGNKRLRKTSTTLNTEIKQTIPASDVNTYGRQVNGMGYAIRGTFEGIDNASAAELGAYVLQSDGNWHPVSTATDENKKASILPFRAYLLPSAHNANASIPMQLEDTDGIDTIETIDADGTEHYYDLQGRELPGKPQRGIYIHNGRKVVAK